MNDNFKVTTEEQTKVKSSVKKYIAAGMTAAVFVLCILAGTVGTGEPETADLETDIIPEETVTAVAETAAAAEVPDEETTAESTSAVLTAEVTSFSAEESITSDEDEVNALADESEAENVIEAAASPGSETEILTEAATEADEDMEEIFDDENSEAPTGSFVSADGTRASVKSASAKSSTAETTSEASVRVVVPEMSPIPPQEQETDASDFIGTDDVTEVFTEASDVTAASDMPSVVSRFEVPDWLVLDENGVPTEYSEAIYGKSCAYTAEPDALMSTGKEVFQGYVAVDPDVIPYGSELYIVADDGEVYGYAIAADTGYSVRQGHIIVDLFMDEYDDCIQWGAKNVTVYVLK